ncbi:MAG: 4'-phosphopantetheinyl transferase superfamily protein [Bacteroidales bacterium]|nr:4'-phosphopantetheinyl transferase superfamily protein [Bacteroidales bacterium]
MDKKNIFVKLVSPDFNKNMDSNYLELRNVLANFIKKNVAEINNDTVIDKTVVQGSILIHRMYAEFAELGYDVENYTDIKTFGQLIEKINLKQNIEYNSLNNSEPINTEIDDSDLSVGIDIEKIANFKEVADFREDEFYKQNFTDSEIAHCILQPSPIQSFAGVFAVKEALVKANNLLKNKPFNSFEIYYDNFGKPFFQGFIISISHVDEFAIAIAFRDKKNIDPKIETKTETVVKDINMFWKILSIISFLVSLSLAVYMLVEFKN